MFHLLLDRLPNELRIDVAERANAKAQFNAPPRQSQLNGRPLPAQAALTKLPCCLGFKAHCQAKSAIKLVDMY
jgi:hypothetical protein